MILWSILPNWGRKNTLFKAVAIVSGWNQKNVPLADGALAKTKKDIVIDVLTTCGDLAKVVDELKSNQQTIGVVPTMGALHEGHLSLVRHSLSEMDETIVTIFVNPTQFAPTDDLDKYPRPLDDDIRMLTAEGVKYVFAPSNHEMYGAGFSTEVVPPNVAKKLEGEFRPNHFAGVATVVLKLLNLTQANKAFFGQKDYQQGLVIERMVADLNVPTKIVICPIVRDADGLALSSRNAYLSQHERDVALALSQTLDHAEQLIGSGLTDGFEVITEMRQMLIDAGVERIDYAVVADPQTLETVDPITRPVVALLAAHVGETRLIDNRIIHP